MSWTCVYVCVCVFVCVHVLVFKVLHAMNVQAYVRACMHVEH